MTPLELLAAYGDDPEKAIVANHSEELLSIIEPYAEIWAKYVLPNRTPTGESAKEPWDSFASNHYTALIRLENASLFKGHIDRVCCEKCEGKQLLEIQAYTSAFWWFLGAVVDNLGQAIENFPGMDLSSIAEDEKNEFQAKGKKYICSKFSELGFMYDRRTQHIHSRVIPIGAIGGHPYFDTRYLDGPRRENLPKYTDWQGAYNDPQDLPGEYDNQWREKLKALTNAWNHMRWLFAETIKKEKKLSFKTLDFKDLQPITYPAYSIHGQYITAMASAFSVPPTVNLIEADIKNAPGASGFKPHKK
jgi:hypothetical protein